MQTGFVVVEKVGAKSTVTRCFSKYPLKFIVPNKVGSSKSDAVWIYTLTYGGGIVSGDCVSCDFTIGDNCTAVLTTQASTKVYKSVGSKCSEQRLEARIGSNAMLVMIPDPVTCFATARYSQMQTFRLLSDSSLVVVDWITSGRHESGEKWDFKLYKSMNHIFLEGDQPLFLDSGAAITLAMVVCILPHFEKVVLEDGGCTSIAERMLDYQVMAMIILVGPKLKQVQNHLQEEVRRIMSEQFYIPSNPGRSNKTIPGLTKPTFLASCSAFGPKGIGGLVVRISATTTESVYNFLRDQLSSLEPLLGVSPYCHG